MEVLTIFKHFNFIEIVMPAAKLMQHTTETSVTNPSIPSTNAFALLMNTSSTLNKCTVQLIARTKDNKHILFNEYAKLINSFGATFKDSQVKCGGNVHNVVFVLRDIIWFLDNSMGRFYQLAGGPNCFPKFIAKIGQPDHYDGMTQRVLWDDFVHKTSASQVHI